jgi:xanthine dehydrogenase accessory factor
VAATFKRLVEEDKFSQEDLQRVVTPIGLEIKAETPAEIAISIAAQLIQVRAENR